MAEPDQHSTQHQDPQGITAAPLTAAILQDQGNALV